MEFYVLMDADNPYRMAYYGGFDQDPALPYLTENKYEAIKYPDMETADRAARAIFEIHERGFWTDGPYNSK